MKTTPKHRQNMVAALIAATNGDTKTCKKLLKKAEKQIETFYSYNDQIGKYLNRRTGSDIEPIGKIISVNGNVITLNPVEHELISKMDFHIGGFMANCSNNDEQEYSYTVDETKEFQLNITKSMLKNGYYFSDNPKYFFDYNF